MPEQTIGRAIFDAANLRLRDAQGAIIALRAKSLRLLAVLAEKPDRLISKDALMIAVWGKVVVSDESLVKCAADIRAAIGDPTHAVLETVRGLGYRLNLADAKTGPLNLAPPVIDWDPSLGLWVQAIEVTGASVAQSWTTLNEEISVALAAVRFVRVASTQAKPPIIGIRYHLRVAVESVGDLLRWRLEVADQLMQRIAWVDQGELDLEHLVGAQRLEWIQAFAGRVVMATTHYHRAQARLYFGADQADPLALADRINILAHRLTVNDITEAHRLSVLARSKFPNHAWVCRVAQVPALIDLEQRVSGTWTPERIPELLRYIRHAMRLDPTHALNHGALAQALCEIGQFEEAISVAELALTFGRAHASTQHYFARIVLVCGQIERAIDAARAALAMSPQREEYLTGSLGRALWIRDQSTEGLQLLRETIVRKPERNFDRLILMLALDEIGDSEGAARHAQHLQQHAPFLDQSYLGLKWQRLEPFADRLRHAMQRYGFAARHTAPRFDSEEDRNRR